MLPKHLYFLLFLSLGLPLDLSAQTASQEKLLTEQVLSKMQYRCVGPTRGGRVTAVAGITSQPSTYYMGATGGGVWKTEDYGVTWNNVSDGYFATPSIGAISVYQPEPEIVYVGTGSDGLRSNVIAGKGVYKSIDAGKTWQHIGLEKTGQIGAVEIHPDNPDRVFVAAIGQPFQANPERGLYRTEDGGKTWEQVLFINNKIGIVDVEFAPDNPDIIYAAAWKAERKPWTIISGGYQEGGIYKSVDGGDTWKKLSNGLPKGLIGKADLTVSPNDPKRVYTLIEAPETDNADGRGGLYRSDDFGDSFQLVSTKKELLDRPFYYCNIQADPQNADVLYGSATRFFKSTDGGKNWTRLSTPHGDNHDIWINPYDSLNFIQANDGGANVTMNGGKSWSSQFNQATAELYQVEVDDQIPYWLYAGQQDNYTTIALPSLPPYTIQGGSEALILNVGGCETGPAVPKPGNPNIVYANCKGRFGVYDKRTGQEKQYYVGAGNMYGHNPKELKYRFQRVSPIHVSPHNPDVVYHASQYVHKTTNDGQSWETISPDLTAFEADKQMISGSPITRDITGEEFYSTIYSLRESVLEEGVIWSGANDGPVYVTRNGGKDGWKNVTPKELPKGGRIDCVAPSFHQKGKAYFTSLRYQLGDWKPYIYRTTDYGATWTLLTDGNNGIPADYPVRVVREDPDREGLLYAGTEYGLFISFDDGENWLPFQNNLPVTPVTDIKVHQQDLVLSTMGRSFWIMDDLTVLHKIQDAILQKEAHLFQPRDQFRLRYRATSKKAIPYYPGNHVAIHYWLKEKPTGNVEFDILNENGDIIRSYQNKQPQTGAPERDMSTEFFVEKITGSITPEQGLNTLHWDMRHDGVWDEDAKKSGRRGPIAAPGEYTVRMTMGNTVLHKTFQVLTDPNVAGTGLMVDDLVAQEKLALEVRDLSSKAKQLLYQVEKELKKDNPAPELERIVTQLKTKEGRYQKPMLIDQLRYLRGMIGRADQRPGQDAYERLRELNQVFDGLKATYLDIIK